MNYNVHFRAEKDTLPSKKDMVLIIRDDESTLTYHDFMKMPDMDFKALSKMDPEIYALFN